MRTLVIINPFAAKTRRTWPTIKQQLDSAGVDYNVHETTSPGDATNKTRAALKSGVETVLVVGGDGTLGETAEGFFEFNDDLESASDCDQSCRIASPPSRRNWQRLRARAAWPSCTTARLD